MQSKFKNLLFAAFALTIFACQLGEKKNEVDAQVVSRMESFAEKAKAVQPKIDEVKNKVNSIANRYMLNPANLAQDAVSLGSDSEGAQMVGVLGQRTRSLQEQYTEAMKTYGDIMARYKSGSIPAAEAPAIIEFQEKQILSLEEAAGTTLTALDVAEEKLKTAPPAPMKGGGKN